MTRSATSQKASCEEQREGGEGVGGWGVAAEMITWLCGFVKMRPAFLRECSISDVTFRT